MVKLSDIKENETVTTKKNHPCGSNLWTVLSKGAEFKLQCRGCGRTIVIASETLKKSIKNIAGADSSARKG